MTALSPTPRLADCSQPTSVDPLATPATGSKGHGYQRKRSHHAQLLKHATDARAQGHQWKHTYRACGLLVDTIAVVGAVIIASVGRFGLPLDRDLNANSSWTVAAIYSAALVVTWLGALGVQQSRDLSLVGVGAEEYRRVLKATAWVFGIIAAGGLLFNQLIARGYLLIALPVGLISLLIGRHLLRRNLAKKRASGEFVNHVVVLGKPDSVISLWRTFDRQKFAGYKIIGACVPGYDGMGDVLETPSDPVPIFGDESSVEQALRLTSADVLAVTAVEHLGHEYMRKLAWRLDSLRIDLVVMPGMTDIAGPRLKIRPIDNLPLFHIARPRHDSSASKSGKRMFDLTLGTVALVLFIPLLIVVALAIKLGDGGPVFFRQERVGLHGARFRIFKFRTMLAGSDALKDVERISKGQADDIFYKSAEDTRITRVGRFLRTTSIDELPQLFNVLAGSMSIVGPRPLVPGEGESIDNFIERRALVKPGITGLWQVSGRSAVPAEERIRLDHSYVDNWSCFQDIVIVGRTLGAVLKRKGAY